MKLRKLALVPIAAAIMGFGTPAVANSLLFQGVTFETFAVDNDTLGLSISGALSSGSGNWLDINYLKAFELKNIGDVTSASIASGPGYGSWTASVTSGVADSIGCTTGGTPGACFSASPAVQLTDSMTWNIDFGGSGLHFNAPELKVQFLKNANDTSAQGSLLSQPIPGIPEPEIYAMLVAGLGLMGFVARRRRQSLESGAA